MLKDKTFVLIIISLILYTIFIQYEMEHVNWLHSCSNYNLGSKRRKKESIRWETINRRISERKYRRMFRITNECFALLCGSMIIGVGEEHFKSEAYIDAFLKCKNKMYDSHIK